MPSTPTASLPPPTLLRNAHVFAPEDLGLRQVLVAAGRVLWIGAPDDAAPSLPGLEVVDLGGKRLIPGLIDAHAHVTGGGGEGGFATRVPPVPLSAFTAAGVTTVVGPTNDQPRFFRSLDIATEAADVDCDCGAAGSASVGSYRQT